jgi:hypothetical protein
MRKNFLNVIGLALLASTILPLSSQAQSPDREFYLRPSYWRPHDQRSINYFETNKTPDTIPFEGVRFRMGAGFTQEFQSFTHSNTSNVALYKMGPGFNLAMANMIFDVQLADGIRLDLTTYLSTRHHNETWVKGGYIQFDKLPFKGQFWNDLMKYATIKIGHMEINYGDQHFRRSDAGATIQNPFSENYIADAFSTEIGGEVYLQKDGFFGMVGVTNGTINSSIAKQGKDVGLDSSKKAAVYFKAGVDKTLGKLRVRLTGSAYMNNKSQRNVLYGGDRGGSWYFGVMNPDADDLTKNAFSGRFNPGFSRSVHAYMINGFLKYGGFELFGTYEFANGSAYTTSDPSRRKMDQKAIDLIYRLGKNENLYAAFRYNIVNAEMPGFTEKVKIDRTAIAGGWFLTRNILLKAEYVWQNYKNYETTATPNTNILAGGNFNGYTIQAVVGF